ncbi:peptidase M24 [Thermobaculum terrenum ATCC BAA-798]|uniref:Peptidase M24 n=1 Tax=Thermobaculum terrenum (strain ATCC BAA-798 / CCMEE 7001 / YNP1) TaxID=525904 RepID=D1CH05_THET1|nr:Xaa-Pro peptidase family protein [Thermobaculum terrenum]ACZ43026.1 peptidase M24 [Thermobaculum terrenum ATCC BAA-798]
MDSERLARAVDLMTRLRYDALLCRVPEHVFMLTGYLPVMGNSFCLVRLDPGGRLQVLLAVPEDERDLVPPGAADDVRTFSEETGAQIQDTLQAVRECLQVLLISAALGPRCVIGYEGGQHPITAPYTQVGFPGKATVDLLRQLRPEAELVDATPLLDRLAAFRTQAELGLMRQATTLAILGFDAARSAIVPDATEADVEAQSTAAIIAAGRRDYPDKHIAAHVHVMSGERSARAYRAYNTTSDRMLQRGDPVLVQMEVCVGGCWAELTRTFFVGEISRQWEVVLGACMRAQREALYKIRPGASGSKVDAEARKVMRDAGLGEAFRHGLGHGVGLQAINHGAQPRLHPASGDVLHPGMTHNVEPAAYLDGQGGLRLNDNVLVIPTGCQLLSQGLPRAVDWLVAG